MRVCAAAGALACAVGLASGERVDLLVYENASGVATNLDLWVDVVADASTVMFTFHNDSALDPVMTSIYFESTGFVSNLSGGQFDTGSSGVVFNAGSSPPNPAALNGSGFWGGAWTGTGASFGAIPSPVQHGIGVGEFGSFGFNNDLSLTTADFIALFEADVFRVAAHVQRIGPDGEQSVWVITPAPASCVLLGFGGLVCSRRRR